MRSGLPANEALEVEDEAVDESLHVFHVLRRSPEADEASRSRSPYLPVSPQHLQAEPADAEVWLLLAQTQALLQALAPAQDWGAARDASLARAQALGPLNALQQRLAAQARADA